jgi:hypothetical protein
VNYLKKSFTVPVQVDIPQEEWDAIWARKCPDCGHLWQDSPACFGVCATCGWISEYWERDQAAHTLNRRKSNKIEKTEVPKTQ